MEIGSENVFRDLGLPNPEARMLKAELMLKIGTMIKDKGLSQKDAAKLLGITQPNASHLMRGHLDIFSVEKLLGFFAKLGFDVDIFIKQIVNKSNNGRIRVIEIKY